MQVWQPIKGKCFVTPSDWFHKIVVFRSVTVDMLKYIAIWLLVIAPVKPAKWNCFSVDDVFVDVVFPTFEDEMSEKGKFHDVFTSHEMTFDIRGFVRFHEMKQSSARICSEETSPVRMVELQIDSLSTRMKIFVERLSLKFLGKVPLYDGNMFVDVPSMGFNRINTTIVFTDKKCDLVFKYDRFHFDRPEIHASWFVSKFWNFAYSTKAIRTLIETKINSLVSSKIISAVMGQREAICNFLRN
ncbi:hypothetical protein GE061_005771 [Apolygus lucorum]|uniref:Uncharacterized protein n=1 Tax=Apolygus lucorum TaxID=248454 RepID=A0A8S9WXB4_APOLU|nr:hypothetical protein GE061_005771 [Apolygus lucorum]